jgi:predicted TIM-barrel fold metal-dependent hydrolase
MDQHRGVNWHATAQEIEEFQVMFGSDFPYREAMEAVQGLANYKLSEADPRTIESENAYKMFPRLKPA